MTDTRKFAVIRPAFTRWSGTSPDNPHQWHAKPVLKVTEKSVMTPKPQNWRDSDRDRVDLERVVAFTATEAEASVIIGAARLAWNDASGEVSMREGDVEDLKTRHADELKPLQVAAAEAKAARVAAVAAAVAKTTGEG